MWGPLQPHRSQALDAGMRGSPAVLYEPVCLCCILVTDTVIKAQLISRKREIILHLVGNDQDLKEQVVWKYH